MIKIVFCETTVCPYLDGVDCYGTMLWSLGIAAALIHFMSYGIIRLVEYLKIRRSKVQPLSNDIALNDVQGIENEDYCNVQSSQANDEEGKSEDENRKATEERRFEGVNKRFKGVETEVALSLIHI